MNIIDVLPMDILRTIVYDWIDHENCRELVMVDTAICHRMSREKYSTCIEMCPVAYKSKQYEALNTSQTSFQAFFGWANIRGLVLTKLHLSYNCHVHLLPWKNFHSLVDLAIELKFTLNMNTILNSLPRLESFAISGKGTIIFTPTMADRTVPCSLNTIVLDLMNIVCENQNSLLQYWGEQAKVLRKVDLIIYSEVYDSWYAVLRFLPNLEHLEFGNYYYHREQELDALVERIGAMVSEFCNKSFPSILKLYFAGMENVLLPFLPKFPNLEDINIRCDYDYSEWLVPTICENFSKLKKLTLASALPENLLLKLTANSLIELDIIYVLPEAFAHICNRFTSLEKLSIEQGLTETHATAALGILSFCAGTMIHLKELSLMDMYISDHAYIALLSSCAIFPSLTHLSLGFSGICRSMETVDHANQVHHLFYHVMISPLHRQLKSLNIDCPFNENIFAVEEIAWNEVPIWGQLEEAAFRGVSLFCLEEFLLKAPNLLDLDIDGNVWNNPIVRETNIMLRYERKKRLLVNAFQHHANRLRNFTCRWDEKYFKGWKSEDEYSFWNDLLAVCPSSLNSFVIHKSGNVPYWNSKVNESHRKLLRKYQHKVRFYDAC